VIIKCAEEPDLARNTQLPRQAGITRLMRKTISLLVAGLLTSCYLPLSVPPMVAVEPGTRLYVDGQLVPRDQYGELEGRYDTFTGDRQHFFCIETKDAEDVDFDNSYGVRLNFLRGSLEPFPEVFDHRSIINNGNINYDQPGGGVAYLYDIPPGVNLGLLSPAIGRQTKLFLSVNRNLIIGYVEVPLHIKNIYDHTFEDHVIRFEFNEQVELKVINRFPASLDSL
jgi:hypothetical protein